MKGISIAYWTITGLFSAFMIFSSYDNALSGEKSVQFLHDYMGYPTYFIPWVGWAKIIGAIALVLPMVPPRVKEWAYFGLFIDLLTATYSFIALGADASSYLFMALFISFLIASYVLYHKRLSTRH